MTGQILSTIDFRSRTGGGILVPVLDDPVLDDPVLADWCDRYLDARPARVLFRSGHLSAVIGAELTDGRPVVIKSRPFDPRIAGCLAGAQMETQFSWTNPLELADRRRSSGLGGRQCRVVERP